MFKRLLVLAVVLGLTTTSFAEETYKIVIRNGAQGERLLCKSIDREETRLKILTADGKAMQDMTETKVVTKEYVETILPNAKDGTTRLTRDYKKATVTQGDKTTALPYQGKTVLIENKKGNYHFSVDGKELTGADTNLLKKEFQGKDKGSDDLRRLLLPAKPVAVGEEWKLDMAKAGKVLADFDVKRGKGTGKLLKVHMKDGRRFGVIEYHLSVPLKVGLENAKADVRFDIKVDACIDGSSSDYSAEFKGQGSVDGPMTGNQKLRIQLEFTTTSSSTTLPKK